MSTDIALQIDLFLRLLLAAVLGAAIGIEREAREQPAGMRTHMLVSVGSAAFTVLSIYGFQAPGADPARVAAQIVSGIGFLGAGAILKYGANVRGLTTAASLWAVAAVGMAAGAGSWGVALGTTAIVVFSLGPLRFVERRLFATTRSRRHVRVSAADTAAFGRLLDALDEHADKFRELGGSRSDGGALQVDLEVRGRSGREVAALLAELDALEGVDVGATGPNVD
jgi:putative Mg2+ transporter-C (MgtC) family protein